MSPEIPTYEFFLSHPQIPRSTDSHTYTLLDIMGSLKITQINFLTFEMSFLSIFPKVTQSEVFPLLGLLLLPVREPCNRGCSSYLVLFSKKSSHSGNHLYKTSSSHPPRNFLLVFNPPDACSLGLTGTMPPGAHLSILPQHLTCWAAQG